MARTMQTLHVVCSKCYHKLSTSNKNFPGCPPGSKGQFCTERMPMWISGHVWTENLCDASFAFFFVIYVVDQMNPVMVGIYFCLLIALLYVSMHHMLKCKVNAHVVMTWSCIYLTTHPHISAIVMCPDSRDNTCTKVWKRIRPRTTRTWTKPMHASQTLGKIAGPPIKLGKKITVPARVANQERSSFGITKPKLDNAWNVCMHASVLWFALFS